MVFPALDDEASRDQRGEDILSRGQARQTTGQRGALSIIGTREDIGDGELAARTQNAKAFDQRCRRETGQRQRAFGEHAVERCVGERQSARVARNCCKSW